MTSPELFLFPAAFAASFVGSLVGLGGGFLFIPLASLGLGLPLRDAIFLSLINVFFLSGFHSLQNKKLFQENKELIAPCVLMAAIGASLSSILAQKISTQFIQIGLGFLILYCCLITLYRRALPISQEAATKASKLIFLFSGSLAGIFGLGGGIINVPLLYRGFKFAPPIATKLSFFFIFAATGLAIITQFHLRQHEIQKIPLAWPLFSLAGVVSAFWISKRLNLHSEVIKKLFVLILAVIGIWTLIS